MITVLWEEVGLLAVHKPGGTPVQPDRSEDLDVLQLVRSAYPEAEVGLIHRLDRPVSGVLLLALNATALAAMNRAFQERRVRKTYLTIVEGSTPEAFSLEDRIRQDARSHKARLDPAGEVVRLHARRIVQGERYALVEVEPETGRFHQIRAQLAAAGTPIKGDVKYGARRGEKDRTIALHAHTLSFAHPLTQKQVVITAAPPATPLWSALLAQVAERGERD